MWSMDTRKILDEVTPKIPAVVPHPLMPDEMILRASTYGDTEGTVHLALEPKGGGWTVFGSGASLGEAAAELFRVVDHAGGLVAFRDSLLNNARASGLRLVFDEKPLQHTPNVRT